MLTTPCRVNNSVAITYFLLIHDVHTTLRIRQKWMCNIFRNAQIYIDENGFTFLAHETTWFFPLHHTWVNNSMYFNHKRDVIVLIIFIIQFSILSNRRVVLYIYMNTERFYKYKRWHTRKKKGFPGFSRCPDASYICLYYTRPDVDAIHADARVSRGKSILKFIETCNVHLRNTRRREKKSVNNHQSSKKSNSVIR